MINALANEGVRGLQTASREIQKTAQEVASFSLPKNPNASPQTPDDVTLPPVNDANKPERDGNIAEPVVELKRQALLFGASAEVVSVANDNIGTLLDINA